MHIANIDSKTWVTDADTLVGIHTPPPAPSKTLSGIQYLKDHAFN